MLSHSLTETPKSARRHASVRVLHVAGAKLQSSLGGLEQASQVGADLPLLRAAPADSFRSVAPTTTPCAAGVSTALGKVGRSQAAALPVLLPCSTTPAENGPVGAAPERELAPFRHLKTWDLAENRREWYARAAAEHTVKVTSHDSPPATAIKTLDFPDPLLSLYEPMANARSNIVPRPAGLGLVESFSLHDDETIQPAPPVEQPSPSPDTVDTEPEPRPSPPPVASEFTDVQTLPVEEVTLRQVPPSTPALTTETADWVLRERAHRKRRWQWAAVVAGCVAIAAVFFVVALQSHERTAPSAVVEEPKPANGARQVTQDSASEGRPANGSVQRERAPALLPSQTAPARTEASATTSPRTEIAPKPEQPSSKLPSPRNPSRKTRSSDRSRSESRPAASSPPAVGELPLDKAFSPTPSF